MHLFIAYKKRTANITKRIILVVLLMSFQSEQVLSLLAAPLQFPNQFSGSLITGLSSPYAAPEISGIERWVNSAPLTLNKLKGKVVLVSFWTFSCINCIRTLPHLSNWYQLYRDRGFVLIGVHTPEFDFEKKYHNVKDAVLKYKILYPIALDNNFTTWKNFRNHYWPALYLINQDGVVVYTHFGEGSYDVTESNIRMLLGIKS